MAQLVAPAADGSAKLNKEQALLIQAEKKKDNDTREQLEKVYGAAQGARLRRVHLTRFANKAWKCPACGAMSRDIRAVCERCLTPEPDALSRQRPYKEKPPRRSGEAAGTTASTKVLPPPQWLSTRGPTQTRDQGVQLIRLATTQRVYRQWSDPITPVSKTLAKRPHGEVAAYGHDDADNDDVDDEELEEANEERVYNDAPEGCAPGARYREVTDPRRGDEVDEGEDGGDDDNNAGDGGGVAPDAGVIGDARPPGNPHSNQSQKRVMPERPFTHFIALPIGKLPGAKASCESLLSQLRDHIRTSQPDTAIAATSEVATASPAATLSEEMVSPVPKLHFTLLLLTLPTPQDVAFAVELLNHFKKLWDDTKAKHRLLSAEESAEAAQTSEAARMHLAASPPHRPLISLGEGLRVMPTGQSNDSVNVKKASVVYMSPRDESSRAAVSTIQSLLHTCFRELIDRPDEAEKSKRLLHMTVVNKKWRRHAAKRPFDATTLLEAFSHAVVVGDQNSDTPFELGTVELNRLSGGNRDEGYLVEASVEL